MLTSWNQFDILEDKPADSLLWVSTGDAGSGKSFFSLTAPAPIWVAAFDPWGMNRVDRAIKVGKDIRISRYPFDASKCKTSNEVREKSNTIWQKFLDDYHLALETARTIIWDREDMVYKIQRYGNFGGSSAAPKDYEDLHIEYAGLLQDASAAGVNLGLLRGIKEQWVSKFDAGKQKMVGHNTGVMIPDGMKKVDDHVDVSIYHRWDDTLKSYVTKIGKFTNPEYRGVEVPNLTFPQMAFAAFPDSDEASWQ